MVPGVGFDPTTNTLSRCYLPIRSTGHKLVRVRGTAPRLLVSKTSRLLLSHTLNNLIVACLLYADDRRIAEPYTKLKIGLGL